MATRFFNPTDAIRVAGSPRIGVGPGFDSQGSVTFFHKYCFPNLHWIHWANPWWSDSAIYSNIQVHQLIASIQRLVRRFLTSNSLQHVYYFVFCHSDRWNICLSLSISHFWLMFIWMSPLSPKEFEIVRNYPKRRLACKPTDEPISLAAAGFSKSEMLFVNDLESWIVNAPMHPEVNENSVYALLGNYSIWM